MEIQDFIDQMKIVYDNVLNYFEDESKTLEDRQDLIQFLISTNISEKRTEFITLLSLISKISNHHHRSPSFNQKIDSILLFLSNQIKESFKNKEIFNIFKNNKRLLLFLIENDIFTVDQEFAEYCQNEAKRQYYIYFYPEIKSFIQNNDKSIESKYQSFDESKFKELRRIGENEDYICSLMRNDSIEEFVVYVTKTNYPLSNSITPSIFETHPLLQKKNATLIEYSAFFGSIQIFQYLQFNNVNLSKYLWDYVTCSNNPDLVHHLEYNSINPDGLSYKHCFNNSIKCHHNEFAEYFYDKMIKFEFNKLYGKCITKSLNFAHYPNDILSLISNPEEDQNFKINEICLLIELLTIPTSLNEIKNEVFSGLKFVKNIKIPSSVTLIGNYAFCDCSSLTQISIPSSVTSIGIGAFKNCSSLNQIEIKCSIDSIEKSVFEGCSSLISIEIPSSVTKINESSFSNCSSLRKIKLPNSVGFVGENAFAFCSSLKEIDLSPSLTFIGAGCFSKCESLEQIEIQSLTIKRIENRAFEGCSSLTRIEIPSSVISIGNCSFNECSNLNEVIIPKSVKSIENSAFAACSSLEQIELPSSLKILSSSAFIRCIKLKKMKIPHSITSIECNVFNRCISLEEIIIPCCVTAIGNHAFDNCKSLTNLKFVDDEGSENFVESIGSYGFKNCSSLTEIIIPSSVTIINDNTFECCTSLISVIFRSQAITSIGENAFSECTSLERITLPNSVTTIKANCFKNCLKLKEIELPSSLKTIGNNAFCNCASLEKVTIPISTQFIGLYAFTKCTSLKTITIPSSTYINYGSFSCCHSLTTIYTERYGFETLRIKMRHAGINENVKLKSINFF